MPVRVSECAQVGAAIPVYGDQKFNRPYGWRQNIQNKIAKTIKIPSPSNMYRAMVKEFVCVAMV